MKRRFLSGASLVIVGLLACAPAAEESDSTKTDLSMGDLPVKLAKPWEAGTFTQLLDHGTDGNDPIAAPADADADAGTTATSEPVAPKTYRQRYWINRSFSTGPSSPVLFFLCGESACSPSDGMALADSARVLGAAIVVLEHRFYGQSSPDLAGGVGLLRYLTIHDALEDAAAFQRHAMAKLRLAGKWIAAGGSYPGALAAFYRLKHPELVVGAWASSAPIKLTTAFPGYDALAARTLGERCSLLVRKAEDAIATRLADPSRRADLVQRLYGTSVSAEELDAVKAEDLTAFLVGSAQEAAQYAKSAELCSSLLQHEDDPLEGYLAFTSPLFADEVTRPGSSKAAKEAPLTPGGNRPVASMPAFVRRAPAGSTVDASYAWTYQTCAQFGCFQVYNPDRTQSVMPTSFDEASIAKDCREQFGILPNVQGIRATYAEPILAGQATNILFVNGEDDPWSALSIIDPAAAPAGIDVYVVRGGSHCSDMNNLYRGMPAGVFEVHKKFAELARKWLGQ